MIICSISLYIRLRLYALRVGFAYTFVQNAVLRVEAILPLDRCCITFVSIDGDPFQLTHFAANQCKPFAIQVFAPLGVQI